MTENFNYKGFAHIMAEQAKDLLPSDISENAKIYIIKTIESFATMAGEALSYDSTHNLSLENQEMICQIIAEWIFHKTIDMTRAGISQKYWEIFSQKMAFAIFEITKKSFAKGMNTSDMLHLVEESVNKTFKEMLDNLLAENKISKEVYENALKESNIDRLELEHSLKKTEPQELENVTKKQRKFSLDLKGNICRFLDSIKNVISCVIDKIFNIGEFLGGLLVICFRSKQKIKFFYVLGLLTLFVFFSKEISIFVSQYNIPFSKVEIVVYITFAAVLVKTIFSSLNDDIEKELDKLEATKQNMLELTNTDRQYERLGVDILAIGVGASLLPIADPDNEEGTLLANIVALRQMLADTLGYVYPNVRTMDCAQLDDFEYSIEVRGNVVANGFVYPRRLMIGESIFVNIENESLKENSIQQCNPITQETVYWVDRDMAEILDIKGLEPAKVITKHLEKVVIKYVNKIMTTGDVYKYLEQAKKVEYVEHIVDRILERIDIEDIRKIFVKLIEKEVPIKDVVYVLERINEHSKKDTNVEHIVEQLVKDILWIKL